MNNKGFISSAVVYSFFIIFLILMVYLISSYSTVRFMLSQIKYDIRSGADLSMMGDLSLYIYVYDEEERDYTLANTIPLYGYDFEEYSYCKNGSRISYMDGKINIVSPKKDICYAYFRQTSGDITLNMYTVDENDKNKKLVLNIPDNTYFFKEASCTKGSISYDSSKRKFDIKTNDKTVCNATFKKKSNIVTLKYYIEDASGKEVYEDFKYSLTSSVGSEYSYYGYKCKNGTTLTYDRANNKFDYKEEVTDTCNIYYRGGSKLVDMKYMKENTTGVAGFTSGLFYTETINIPKIGYRYVGYKCNSDGVITRSGDTFIGTSSVQDTCYLYFDKYDANARIYYYLQTGESSYSEVFDVPSTGYKYNSSMSKCENGSVIRMEGNTAYVNSNDTCHIYFDKE